MLSQSTSIPDLRAITIPAILVALELSAAFTMGQVYGFPYSLAIRSYLITGAVIAFAVMLFGFLVLLARNARRGAERALDGIFTPSHLLWGATVAAGIMLVSLQICVLNWTKSMLPHVTEFWADPALANFDSAIFRTDPWQLTHAVFGEARWIDTAYITWAFLKFGTLLVLFALPSSTKRTVAILAYFIAMAIGCFTQYLLPSGGPIFYELLGHGDRFAELPFPPFAQAAADYLWAGFKGGGQVGGGISAMPSMHVTMSAWMALVTYSFDRRLGLAFAAYYAVIWLGSVHTGYHYAVDGLAGSLIALGAWALAGKLATHVTASRSPVSAHPQSSPSS